MTRTSPAGVGLFPGLIVCGKAGDVLYETDATLEVEVSSPSTRAIDRREKVAAYATLPSILMYALVEPTQRHVEVASWVDGQIGWRTYGPGEVLASPFGALAVDDVYDEVDSLSTTD